MDDIPTILANEGIKNFLHKEIKGPIGFLEDALRELKMVCRSELKEFKSAQDKFQFELVDTKLKLCRITNSNLALEKQLSECKEEIAKAAPIAWVEQELMKNNDRVEKALSEMSKYHKDNDKRSKDIEKNIDIMMNDDMLASDKMDVMSDRLDKGISDINRLKVSDRESKEKLHSAQDEVSSSVQKLLENLIVQLEKQNSKIEQIGELVEKTDKRLKKDAAAIVRDLREQIKLFESEFTQKMSAFSYKRVNVEKELDRLDQEMIRLVKASGGREVDDFIKQVGYNARQIMIIQNSLEDK